MDGTFGPGTDLPGGPGIPRRPGAPGSPCSKGRREKKKEDFAESEHDHLIEKTFMQQFAFNSTKILLEFLVSYSVQSEI